MLPRQRHLGYFYFFNTKANILTGYKGLFFGGGYKIWYSSFESVIEINKSAF